VASSASPRSSAPTVWQRLVALAGPRAASLVLRFYPPLLGAGIRVARVAPGFREMVIEMPLRPWTRNYVGTHFGGSLYAMCDPFYMLMLMENLGSGYVVWDKSATIEFLKPGRGTVRARFQLSEEQICQVRDEVERNGRCLPQFTVTVEDDKGQAVAKIGKVLSVRKASAQRQDANAPPGAARVRSE